MSPEERRQAILAHWDRCASPVASEELYEWERDFYLKHLKAGCRVLLVGCGSGRDLAGLIRKGFAADGLEIAPRAVALCRDMLARNGMKPRLYDVPIDDARLEGEYDAAVFTWQGYGLIPESADRVRALQSLRAALRKGGRVLLTYLASPTSSNIVELSISGGRLALYIEHRFTPEEIVAEATAAGLRVASHEQADLGRVVVIRD